MLILSVVLWMNALMIGHTPSPSQHPYVLPVQRSGSTSYEFVSFGDLCLFCETYIKALSASHVVTVVLKVVPQECRVYTIYIYTVQPRLSGHPCLVPTL